MWFLEIDKLLIISAFALLMAFLRVLNQKLKNKIPVNYILLAIAILVMAYVDKRLAIFYVVYTLVTYIMSFLLFKAKKARKALFLTACLLATLPFFLGRISNLQIFDQSGFVIVGIAYSIFKVIDAYYHVYYSGESINFLTYINYILFLPVITSGPMHRYRDFKKSIDNPIEIDILVFSESIKRIIRGLFKKLVLVNLLMIVFNHLQTLEISWNISLAIILMSYLILYFDLSGYSDIAIAFGSLYGILVPENFKKPWSAPTMTQFWRNWHVTLSDYIREHIYVVVVKKKLNKYQGGFIGFSTMLIMALWHGFYWHYALAGAYLGLILFFENVFSLTSLSKRTTNKFYFAFRCLLTNFLFAVNTLVFTIPKEDVLKVIFGLFSV